MNSVPRWPLILVALCAAAVLGALGWATSQALHLERRERDAQAQAAFQEKIRLALWRMDSALAPIITREAVRPYFQYQPFYAADRAYTAMFEEVKPGDVLVPSPLLQEQPTFVRVHFQRAPRGGITSPQVPTGNMRDLAESAYVSSDRVIAAEEWLTRLSALLRERDETRPGRSGGPRAKEPGATQDGLGRGAEADAELAESKEGKSIPPAVSAEYAARKQIAEQASNAAQIAAAPDAGRRLGSLRQERREVAPTPTAQPGAPGARDAEDQSKADIPAPATPNGPETAEERSEDGQTDPNAETTGALDKDLRTWADPRDKAETDQGLKVTDVLSTSERVPGRDAGAAGAGIVVGELRPVWAHAAEELLLVRDVRSGGTVIEQGCWLDWPRLRAWLVLLVRDLLPGAVISPIEGRVTTRPLSMQLAAIPAELVPGAAPPPPALGWTPMRTTLALTWVAALAALGGLAAIAHAARRLAERRGRFVSAVTHELRTPLTTFVMYSQMLADGMVGDESTRGEYLGTLKREAGRLSRIVENVLEYARLGKRSPKAGAELHTIEELLARVVPTLRQRCEQSGAVLTDRSTCGPNDATRADPLVVERVLYNLVDNACKYGLGEDKRIELDATRDGPEIVFTIRDHGPGLAERDRARLFKAFERGSRLEHASTPGLGLGLALSRELARRAHGDVRLVESSGSGTAFELRLPAASP